MYYLYHIPGKKIGVTCDLNKRVNLIQGYKEGEYEVLVQSDDIDYISDKELVLQKEYGYKIDRKLYKLLKKETKSMKINVTEQTTTFPYPISKLKGNLMDNIGFQWESSHGLFVLNNPSIRWIINNVQTTMYNNDRCYVYNKAFAREFIENKTDEKKLKSDGRVIHCLPMIQAYVIEVPRFALDDLQSVEGVEKVEYDTRMTAQLDVAIKTGTVENVFSKEKLTGKGITVAFICTEVYRN